MNERTNTLKYINNIYSPMRDRTARCFIQRPLSSESQQLLQCWLGLIGELKEIVDDPDANLQEEVGDVIWYLTPLLIATESLLETNVPYRLVSLKECLDLFIDKTDDFKKYIFQNNESKLKEAMPAIWYLYFHLVNKFEIVDVCEANIAKLKARYPEGFQEGGGIR